MKVKDLLTDESKWTQNVNARTEDGSPCEPKSTNATQWCLFGALCKCYKDHNEFTDMVHRIQKHTGHDPITTWNDVKHRTFADVSAIITALNI